MYIQVRRNAFFVSFNNITIYIYALLVFHILIWFVTRKSSNSSTCTAWKDFVTHNSSILFWHCFRCFLRDWTILEFENCTQNIYDNLLLIAKFKCDLNIIKLLFHQWWGILCCFSIKYYEEVIITFVPHFECRLSRFLLRGSSRYKAVSVFHN